MKTIGLSDNFACASTRNTSEVDDAFQFDWICEYVFVGNLRQQLEVTHTKLASSRAF